jgi:hypothetical protein
MLLINKEQTLVRLHMSEETNVFLFKLAYAKNTIWRYSYFGYSLHI